MDLGTILTVAAALIGGGAVKKTSKKKGSNAHKATAPAAAILTAILAQTAQHGGQIPADQLIATGGQLGVWAVFIHTLVKNTIQLVKELRKLKETK